MKIFALLLLAIILAFTSTAEALKDPVCGLAHSQDGSGGRSCLAYFPSWSYRSDRNECVDFVYGGCGGNANRFDTKQECESKCKE